jgi:hypothetical protein
MATLATPANMAAVAETCPGAFAYSPLTGEQFSATPGDYFWALPDEPIIDGEGEPCILAVACPGWCEDALTGEAV